MDELERLLWQEIYYELIDMGFDPDEADQYARDMVRNERNRT